MKPLVGISIYGLSEYRVETDHYERHYLIPQEYVEAVRCSGGVPVLLPPGEDSIGPWLEVVQGVIMSGGTDLDPQLYGGAVDNPRVHRGDKPRDQTELLLARAVLEREIPSLFICRGFQLLNVVRGGTLHAHLPDAEALVDVEDIHRDEAGLWTTHEVEVVAGSRLAKAMGVTAVRPVSGHHQGVDEVGRGLEVVAVAPDGVVEALEVRDHPWALGVQWHPELTAATEPSQHAIFAALVDVAGGRA